jgi:pyruvate,water dikinase
VRQLRENRDAAIKEMWSLVPPATSQEDKNKLKTALDLALKMTPLTPDHHFYMDQGTYARMRLVLMGVGRKLVELGGLDRADDIMFLKYDELRQLSANLTTFDARSIVNERRRAREAAFAVRPRLWAGTITDWSMYGEPYKQVLWDWPGIYERSKSRRRSSGTVRARGVLWCL